MKKIFGLLFLSLLIILSPISTQADTQQFNDTFEQPELNKETYLELIDLGILDETITYETWIQINSEDRTNPVKEKAEDTFEQPELNKETYLELIDLGILDETITYETWIQINSEDRTNPVKEKAKSTAFVTLSGSTSSLVRGDILISNGTSSFGLTGHAGIVVGSDQILHIAGGGYSPSVVKFSTWEARYGKPRGGMVNTEVYRISNWTHRNAAADWAVAKYKNSGASYSLLASLSTFDPTYCSLIVWQAYYYGTSTQLVNKPPTPLATPYGLPTYFKSTANLSYEFNF